MPENSLTVSMIILYILLIAYILAVNFHAFLLIKSLRDKDRETEIQKQVAPQQEQPTSQSKQERYLGKLIVTGVLGGAITLYVSMFIFKWKRSDMLLMLLLPLLGVLNIYLWILLFRSGFRFFIIR